MGHAYACYLKKEYNVNSPKWRIGWLFWIERLFYSKPSSRKRKKKKEKKRKGIDRSKIEETKIPPLPPPAHDACLCPTFILSVTPDLLQGVSKNVDLFENTITPSCMKEIFQNCLCLQQIEPPLLK